MILNTLLRWLLGFVQPFVGWRVPVTLLRGRSKTGRQVTLLSAGLPRWTQFTRERFFEGNPEVMQTDQIPIWSLQKWLTHTQPSADFSVVGVDRISAGLFLKKSYLAMPPLVSSWMPVPENLKAFSRTHSNTASDIRRIQIKKFEWEYSREKADFDLFYDHYHVPYINARYGASAHVAPRWLLRNTFRRGLILWVCRNGERLAGDLVRVNGRELSPIVTGMQEGRPELLKEGVLSALYIHSMDLARRLGCTKINLGGSHSSLHDGVFRYKNKWGSIICDYDGSLSSNFVALLHWNRLTGPVADYFSHTSIIHRDHEGYSAFWAFPETMPLTSENLYKQIRVLNAKGLRRFRILIPDAPPRDFTCPPGVRLIPPQDWPQTSPEVLLELD